MVKTSLALLLLVQWLVLCCGQANQKQKFVVPDVKIEPLEPKGLRVSIPDQPGIQFFAFNGQRNKPLSNVETGEFSGTAAIPEGNVWVILDRDFQLKVGDTLHYYYLVQYNRLGYRNEDRQYKVEALHPFTVAESCKEVSLTRYNEGKTTCPKTLIFEDDFSKYALVDQAKWLIEEYIAINSKPDYEFVTYLNNPKTVFIESSVLHLKPHLLNVANAKEHIKLVGCTSSTASECESSTLPGNLERAPIESGKIRSKFSLKYGKIEIKAKLPAGNWIYPIIHLTTVNRNDPKRIVIAYSRGNTNRKDNLYAGPLLDAEGDRNRLLESKTSTNPFHNDFHVYTLEWNKDKMTFGVDGTDFGKISGESFLHERTGDDGNGFLNQECYISLGVGGGGINDFPDDYTNDKPWRNRDRSSVLSFYRGGTRFKNTWVDNNVALKVDYIKVWAL